MFVFSLDIILTLLGIGRATALAFARDGCEKLLLGDPNITGLEETRSMILKDHPKALVEISRLDITKKDKVDAFYASCVVLFGRIDFAANIAGRVQPAQPIYSLTSRDFDLVYDVNQRGTFFCQRAQLRIMLKQEPLPGYECRGSIVNVTSLCGTVPLLGLAAYSSSKNAVIGMTKVDALDYGPDKIRINSVAPGNTMTPMVAPAMGDTHRRRFAAKTAWRRNGQPEDIANAICWLSSPQAAFITGLNLPVDGGLNLHNPN